MKAVLSTPGINISVARSCFVRCRGCYNHFGKSPELLSDDEIVGFLIAGRDAGYSKVTICGGDPLSRPGLIGLLERVKGLDYWINLDTVGTAMLGDTETKFFGNFDVPKVDASDLAGLVDRIGIPLDGSTEESVASFRTGRSALFQETLAILDLLAQVDANVCINTVVHRQNLDDLAQMARIVSSRTVVRLWQLFQYMPTGPLGFKARDIFEISEEAFADAITGMLASELRADASSAVANVIEPKSASARKGNYLLVDSAGVAWTPMESVGPDWDPSIDATADRNVLGNVRDEGAFSKIFEKHHELVDHVQA